MLFCKNSLLLEKVAKLSFHEIYLQNFFVWIVEIHYKQPCCLHIFFFNTYYILILVALGPSNNIIFEIFITPEYFAFYFCEDLSAIQRIKVARDYSNRMQFHVPQQSRMDLNKEKFTSNSKRKEYTSLPQFSTVG